MAAPLVTSYSPKIVKEKTVVSIVGANFQTPIVTVTFDGSPITPIIHTDSLIEVEVPEDATVQASTIINLTNGGGTVNLFVQVIDKGLHYRALKLLTPFGERLVGEQEADLIVEAKNLDDVQGDLDGLELEVVPYTMTDIDTFVIGWEATLELIPEPGDTVQDRVTRITNKLAQVGGLSKPYFESLALALGFTVILEFPPQFFRAGVSFASCPTFEINDGFLFLAGSGVAHDDGTDRQNHLRHNDDGLVFKTYEPDYPLRQWVWTMTVQSVARVDADVLVETFIKLKPAFTFIEWFFTDTPTGIIDEGDGLVGVLDIIDEGDGLSPGLFDIIDEGDGII